VNVDGSGGVCALIGINWGNAVGNMAWGTCTIGAGGATSAVGTWGWDKNKKLGGL